MQTRRDQIQAYRFAIRRIVSALLYAEPEHMDLPMRRLARAGLGGVIAAVIAVAGVGALSVVRPRGESASWRDGTKLIIQQETKSRYVLVDGALHAVLNYTSARLLLGKSELPTAQVSGRALSKVPHGAPVGIPGAPETLPAARELLSGAWVACSSPGRDSTGRARPVLELSIGSQAPGRLIPAAAALLVRDPAREVYLIWHGQRMRVAASWELDALGYDATQPLDVPAGWLDVIPQTVDLQPLTVPNRGQPAGKIGNSTAVVGQVMVVATIPGIQQYYVVLSEGLAPITHTQAALLLGDPTVEVVYNGGHPRAIPISAAAADAATHSTLANPPQANPPNPPSLIGASPATSSVCASYHGDGTRNVSMSLGTAEPRPADASAPIGPDGSPIADSVMLPTTAAALTRTLPAPGVQSGALYVVDDLGVKYPISSPSALDALGYHDTQPTLVPNTFLRMLRTGPVLNQQNARHIVPNWTLATLSDTASATTRQG
jgi:type VII secretion protein EccB